MPRSGTSRSGLVGTLAVAALMAIAGYAIFFLAPTERTMGEIQRIFYFHVASAWTAFLAFFIVFVANLSYLVRRRQVWDQLAVSAAEVGLAFCTAVFGIFAFLDVPIVYMSIRWWRTQHPAPVIAGGEGSGLDPTMWWVLLVSLTAMVALLVLLLRQRFRLEQLRSELEELRLRLSTNPGNRF